MTDTITLPLADVTLAENHTFTLDRHTHLATALHALLRQLEIAIPLDVHEALAKQCSIAAIWNVDDVKEVRPDLNDTQAFEVLSRVRKCHDAEIGINWEVLTAAAFSLYGEAPEDPD